MANVPGTFYTAETQRRGTTPVSPPSAVDDPQDPVNPSGPPVVPPVAERYASEAAMIADQLNQKSGYLYFDGTDTWWYLGTTNGDITDYEAFGGGGGGISDAPNDGLAYTRKSLAWTQLSPFDLKQEGASNLDVLTWSTASSRYQPETLGQWNVGSDFIYRTSKVSINSDTMPDAVTDFYVRQTAGSSLNNVFFKVADRDGTIILSGGRNAGISMFSVTSSLNIRGGNPTTNVLTQGHTFRGFTVSSGSVMRLLNSAGTILVDFNNNASIELYNGNIILGTTTGTKIGTATSQKIAFWNKTPIIQPTTGITGATRVGGGGTTITDTDTFGGYTIAQLAAILINTGLTA